MKTIRIMTACAAAFLFASCLQVDEPAGIEAIRNAKAELISAEAQYKLAEVNYLNAQTAYEQAVADLKALEVKLKELELARTQAQSDKEILGIQNEIELAILEHQQKLLIKQKDLLTAEQQYAEALAILEYTSKEISAEEAAVINRYTKTLEQLSNNIAAIDLNTLTDNYLTAKYNFQFDYEVTKAEYERDIEIAKAELADRQVFVDYVKGLDATAPVADYVAKVDELQVEIDKAQEEIDALNESKSLKKADEEAPLNEEKKQLAAQTKENNAIISDKELQQKHLYTDNEKYHKVTIDIPPTLVTELHSWFVTKGYTSAANGFVYDYDNLVWTATNNTVDVQFEMPDYNYNSTLNYFKYLPYDMKSFLTALNDQYKGYKDSTNPDEADKAAYAVKTQKYLDEFNSLLIAANKASDAIDVEIDAIRKKQLAVDLRKSEIDLLLNAINVELAAMQKEIDYKSASKDNLTTLKGVYEGLISGTTIKIPKIETDKIPSTDANWQKVVMTLQDYKIGDDPAATQKALDKWALYADYYLTKAEAELAKKEQRLADYLVAENPERFAEQVALEVAENKLEFQTMLYEMYVTQYEYYSKLLKDFLAAVTSGETPTPPADDPQPDEPGEGEGGEGEGGEEA